MSRCLHRGPALLVATLASALSACSGSVSTQQPADSDAGVTDAAPDTHPPDAESEEARVDSAPEPDGTPGPDATPPTDVIHLDPATLQFFSLPINSLREAVSGFDPVARACATLIWDYSNTDNYFGAHCNDFEPGFPYVIVEMDTDGPCGAWDYSANVDVQDWQGCVDFAELGPTSLDLVDVELKVQGAPFSGTIVANNRPLLSPAPVTFGLAYTTDIPEDVYAQTSDDLGLPTWVRVTRAGEPVQLFDRCDIPTCGSSGGVCGVAQHAVLSITGGTYGGSIYLTWDGKIRRYDSAQGCMLQGPAEPGPYTAEFCFGWQIQSGPMGTDLVNPQCSQQEFSYPADEVIFHADFGG